MFFIQVMDRYVDPLVAHLKGMLNYRKFRRGTKTEIDELLRIEKAENPMRIVYCFGISHEHPGTFILTYIRSSNPHHEYIGLYPKGFKFRKRMFEDIDRLVAYFQRHIDDAYDSAPSIRSVAAMVPMRSPATGGSSGFGGGWGGSSNDGGWRGGQSTDRDRSSGSRTGKIEMIQFSPVASLVFGALIGPKADIHVRFQYPWYLSFYLELLILLMYNFSFAIIFQMHWWFY